MAISRDTPNAIRARRPWAGEKPYFKGNEYFKDVLNAIRHAKGGDFGVNIFEKGILADRVTTTREFPIGGPVPL